MVRAVVTGLGCITPIGKDVASFWSALTAGESGVRRITLFDPSDQECQIAAEVKDREIEVTGTGRRVNERSQKSGKRLLPRPER